MPHDSDAFNSPLGNVTDSSLHLEAMEDIKIVNGRQIISSLHPKAMEDIKIVNGRHIILNFDIHCEREFQRISGSVLCVYSPVCTPAGFPHFSGRFPAIFPVS